MNRPVICSIGTCDPWNAAGLGLDARILAELGARCVTVVAAVSAQDARGIRAVRALEPATIRAQWESLADAKIAAVRIGALCSAVSVQTVAALLTGTRLPVVYDPVLRATRGGVFADSATIAQIKGDLLPAVSVCTPNLAEATELSACEIASVDDMETAGIALRAMGANAVLVTGGHLAGDPVDVLVEREGTTRLSAARIPKPMRGAGCVLAAALCFGLAEGDSLRSSVERARAFVRKKIAGAVRTGDFWVAE